MSILNPSDGLIERAALFDPLSFGDLPTDVAFNDIFGSTGGSQSFGDLPGFRQGFDVADFGSGAGGVQVVDNVTGEVLSPQQLQARDPQEWARLFGDTLPQGNTASPELVQEPGVPPKSGGLSLGQLAALLGIGASGLTAALGIGGIAQQLAGGGGGQSTSTTAPNIAAPGATEQATQSIIQSLLTKANTFGGDLSQELQARAPMDNAAVAAAIQRLQSAGTERDTLASQLQPSFARLPGLIGQQANVLGTLPGLAAATAPNASFDLAEQGLIGLLGPSLAQAGGLQNQQLDLVSNAANRPYSPSTVLELGGQALGMAQGRLPTLNDPVAIQRLNEIFNARGLDIDRYLDTAMSGALERSRQQGFAGGNEVFREATPGALLAPALAEAVRQKGQLAGQRAQAEIELAQGLPMLGSQLESQRANLGFAQNAQTQSLTQLLNNLIQQRQGIPTQLGNLEATRVGAGSAAFGNALNAASAFTTPNSVLLGGALNLSNANSNIANLLGNLGQQGINSRLDYLRSISGPLAAANQAALAAQQARERAAPIIQTTRGPDPSLLSAFAPTAQLLGGLGGAIGGLGLAVGGLRTDLTDLFGNRSLSGVPRQLAYYEDPMQAGTS